MEHDRRCNGYVEGPPWRARVWADPAGVGWVEGPVCMTRREARAWMLAELERRALPRRKPAGRRPPGAGRRVGGSVAWHTLTPEQQAARIAVLREHRQSNKSAKARAAQGRRARERYAKGGPASAAQARFLVDAGKGGLKWEPMPTLVAAPPSAAVVYAAPPSRPWPRPKPEGRNYTDSAALLADLATWDADAWAAAQRERGRS